MVEPAPEGEATSDVEPADAHVEQNPDGESSERIGRYVLFERLGSGGMGVVFSAYDPQLERRVALKLLHRDPRELPLNARPRLLREAQSLAKLQHPNVVTIYDVGQFGEQIFIAMEHVDGLTLAQWMRVQTRSIKEIVEVFTKAGRGLDAAHAAGIVHRDFKPDNVLLGRGRGGRVGRVCVGDFGLAVLSDPDPEETLVDAHCATATQEAQTVLARLTATGALMGTPAYMAPEQHAGLPAEPRSDQFAFCVSLYEAIYGTRPFSGRSYRELALRATKGLEELPRTARRVPRYVRQVLARGLSRNPDDRFASMRALLRALRWRRLPIRFEYAVGLAAAVVSASVAAPLLLASGPEHDCTSATRAAADVWNEGRRREVRSALLDSGAPYAGDTWTRVQGSVDAYAQAWAQSRRSACEATRGGYQSEAVLDRRMACLDRRLAHLDATLDVLTNAEPGVLERATAVVAKVPSVSRCEDPEALLAGVAPPEDPAVARKVDALRRDIARLRALESAGLYRTGLAFADAVVRRAEALEDDAVLAEALLGRGLLRQKAGRLAEAEADLSRAAMLAVEVRHDDVALEAMIHATGVVGYMLARDADGLEWGRHARSVADRIPNLEATRKAQLRNNIGAIHFRAGRLAQARAHYEESAAVLRTSAGGNDPRLLAATLNNLANVYVQYGRYAEAASTLTRSIELMETAVGAEHPAVASVLGNLANVRHDQGRFEDALALHDRGYEIRRASLPEHHPYIAASLGNLGLMHKSLRNYAEARDHLRRALALKKRTVGEQHPDYAGVLSNLGEVDRLEGRYADAVRKQRDALAIWERGPGLEHPMAAYPLTNLGLAYVEWGRPDLAVAPLRQALAIRDAAEVDNRVQGETALALARALWDADIDPSRARVLAREARRRFDEAGGRFLELRDQADAWLAAHPG